MNWKVIAIDDEISCLKSLRAQCSKIDHLEFIKGYDDSVKFINNIEKHSDCNLFFVDLDMPGYDGEYVIKKIRDINSTAEIIIISGAERHGTIGTKSGCKTLSKPVNLQDLDMVITIIENSRFDRLIELKNFNHKDNNYLINVKPNDIICVSTYPSDIKDEKLKNAIYVYLKDGFTPYGIIKNTSLEKFHSEILNKNDQQFFKLNNNCIISRACKSMAIINNHDLQFDINNEETTQVRSIGKNKKEELLIWLRQCKSL